jgi:taxis protein CheF
VSEGVIADFIAQFVPALDGYTEPIRGRVVLSRKRLVLAASEERTTIPLSGVFDVTVGTAPRELARFFDDTLTIAYEYEGTRRVAVIEGKGETVERFSGVLFKALLHATTALVVHPARIGGRVTDAPIRQRALKLRPGVVSFRGTDDSLTIDLSAVTHFEKGSRELRGRSRPVLSVRHTDDGASATTEIVLASHRKMNLLGRYVRREYTQVMAEIEEIDLSAEQTEALVALYSAPKGASLARLLGADSTTVAMVLDGLRNKELIADGESTTELTPKGHTVVSARIEDVNA